MIAGRVWTFGDNINTDVMLPGAFLYKPEAEQAAQLFAANRPGWVAQVRQGDIVVGGVNFGTGSARPAARSLRHVGVACLLAESISGLFFRSCVSYGLLALECPGVTGLLAEGDEAQVVVEDFRVIQTRTGHSLPARPVPSQLLDIMTAGGIYPLLVARGYVGRFPASSETPTVHAPPPA